MEDPLGLRPLKEITLGERIVDPGRRPLGAVPRTRSGSNRCASTARPGQWANITKVVGGGQINRHYHVDGR